MARRRKLGRRRSRKMFTRNVRPHKRNNLRTRPMRGGIRL